jgi:hypothetical protein
MPIFSSGLASTRPLDPRSGGRSAPVLEFVCLFTYDLRRKQKRWEDGRIKYHTFNKRVMVYDERGNFVGDMHWQRESDFDEGEEVQLERGGVIVQVAECVGRQEQDLSELLDKRAKEKEQRQARAAMRPPLPAAAPNTPIAGARAQEHFQTRHRPLHQLLGTPTGHHGRAVVPVESPFELRHRADENAGDRPDSHSSKRRKVDATPPSKKTYAQNLFGATLTLSAVPFSSAPRRPPGPLHRAQPETPLPEEQDTSDNPIFEPVSEDQGSAVGPSTRVNSSHASAVAPTSRALPRHDRRSLSEEQEQPNTEPTTQGFPHHDNTVSRPRMNNAPAATRSDPRPTSRANRKSPAVVDKPTTPGDPRLLLTHPTVASSDAQGSVARKLGTTLSQAIDLDEERQFPDRREGANISPESKDGAPGATKQKPKKRKRLPQMAASDVESMTTATRTKDAEEPPMEERTVLRLKPRQKRGLLLLSEKKNKTTQRKAQDTLAVEQSRCSESPEEPANPVAGESSFGVESAENTSATQRDDPFASSPAAFRDPDSLSPPSNGPKTAQHSDHGGSGDTDLIPHQVLPVQDDKKRRPDEPPASPKPSYSDADSTKDRSTSRSPSPRGRRVRSRGKGSKTVDERPSKASNLDSEPSPAGPAPEPILTRSSRQTRASKTLDDHYSSRAKRVRRADSDASAGDELPQVLPRPRLARLSRKSVRSRELIGFVPSSPDRHANSALLPFGARNFEFAEDEYTAGPASPAERPSHESLLSNKKQSLIETQPRTGEPQPCLSSTTVSRAAPPALQRHNYLPNGRMGDRMLKGATEGQIGAPKTPQLDEAPRRRSLARHTSAVLSPKGNVIQNGSEGPPLPGPESIAGPKEETSPEVTVSGTGNPQRPSALDSTTLPSRLHNDSLNLLEQHTDPMSGGSEIAVDACVTEGANKQSPDAPASGPSRPRIANPATRGRKAALKSHAAGQVPQSILPVESAPAVVSMRPPAAPPRPDPAANERPKRTMKFPGFSSARGGGPWSREAHDLLESARPC